jgi:hypothetical protein
MNGSAPGGPAMPDEAQQIRAEIERTREHLGATVEQLAAKVDVKSRARAQVAGLTGQARSRVAKARSQAVTVARGRSVPLAAAAAGVLAAVGLAIWQRGRR